MTDACRLRRNEATLSRRTQKRRHSKGFGHIWVAFTVGGETQRFVVRHRVERRCQGERPLGGAANRFTWAPTRSGVNAASALIGSLRNFTWTLCRRTRRQLGRAAEAMTTEEVADRLRSIGDQINEQRLRVSRPRLWFGR